jgi:hypothetical protein
MSNSYTIFIGISAVAIIGLFLIPGLMGITTGEFSIWNKGRRKSIFTGQKAVVMGVGSVVASVCMLLALYYMVTKNTTKGPASYLIVATLVSAAIAFVLTWFVEGDVRTE